MRLYKKRIQLLFYCAFIFHRIVLLAIFVFLILDSSGLCIPLGNDVIQAAEKVKVTRNKLRTFSVSHLETKISPQVSSLIDEMKGDVEKFVVTLLKEVSINPIFDTKIIEESLNNLVGAGKIVLEENDSHIEGSNSFADQAWFEAKITPDERQLLQIEYTFSIQCGNDSLLMIFEPNKQENTWKEILKWKSGPYKEVYNALNIFQYAISSPDSDGKWYLLGADNPAHCSSCWGVQRYYVLQPGNKDSQPITTLNDRGSHYECDQPTSLVANQSNFEISFPGNSIDSDILIRKHLRHYELVDGRFIRTQPVAQTPRDFVDEWISSHWEEASQWCEKQNCEGLKEIHQFLYKSKSNFEKVTHLNSSDYLFQVGLWSHSGSNSESFWTIVVRKKDQYYWIVSIDKQKE